MTGSKESSPITVPVIPSFERVSIGELYRAVRRQSRRWRRLIVPVTISQIVLTATAWYSVSLGEGAIAGVSVLILVFQLLVHGAVVAMVIDPDCRPTEAVALTLRRPAQLAVGAVLSLLVFAVAFALALPIAYSTAFTPNDESANQLLTVAFLTSFGIATVLVGGRFLAVQPLVMRGLGPFEALGEARRSSRGSWSTGMAGMAAVVATYALIFVPVISLAPGAPGAGAMGVAAIFALILAARIEEGFQSITAARTREIKEEEAAEAARAALAEREAEEALRARVLDAQRRVASTMTKEAIVGEEDESLLTTGHSRPRQDSNLRHPV
ncbi:MAG TPA: hypothetical protein VLA91_17030 [Acidimicrobiia bacterium]|nr:hypothetical protein [Acidimicrobiia bacterium]